MFYLTFNSGAKTIASSDIDIIVNIILQLDDDFVFVEGSKEDEE